MVISLKMMGYEGWMSCFFDFWYGEKSITYLLPGFYLWEAESFFCIQADVISMNEARRNLSLLLAEAPPRLPVPAHS
jgi:hypothetical protein